MVHPRPVGRHAQDCGQACRTCGNRIGAGRSSGGRRSCRGRRARRHQGRATGVRVRASRRRDCRRGAGAGVEGLGSNGDGTGADTATRCGSSISCRKRGTEKSCAASSAPSMPEKIRAICRRSRTQARWINSDRSEWLHGRHFRATWIPAGPRSCDGVSAGVAPVRAGYAGTRPPQPPRRLGLPRVRAKPHDSRMVHLRASRFGGQARERPA